MQFASPAELSPLSRTEPPRDCPLCPRLVAIRQQCRAEHQGWWNAPVPSFGDPQAWLAIVGMAPGKEGANRTGRPFTGDHAGKLLFDTLLKFGLANGEYGASREDGLQLKGAIILNAVKCLPPRNLPNRDEEANCRPFLLAAIGALPKLRTVIALGEVAHRSLCRSFGIAPARARFAHAGEHLLPDGRLLIDSYHCSRLNQNTGVLTAAMFEAVFERALAQ